MARDICVLLGQRIRDLRKARNWRQIDLAEEAGIHENYVSDLELGRKEVCLRTMQIIAHAFGIKAEDLLKGID